MCQCLTGGTCICGPSRAGCKTVPSPVGSSPSSFNPHQVPLLSPTDTYDIPVASTSAIPMSAASEFSADLLAKSLAHRPGKPSPLGLESETSSWLATPVVSSQTGACCQSKAATAQASHNGFDQSSLLPELQAVVALGGCCSSKRTRPEDRSFAPYQVPPPLVNRRPPSPCHIPATPSLTMAMSTSTVSSPEAKASSATLGDDPLLLEAATDTEDLFPPGLAIYDPQLNQDWASSTSDGQDQFGFYGSGGDEDTPFDKHVRNDPMYNTSRPMDQLWPAQTAASSSASGPQVEPHQKEPLGMLFDGKFIFARRKRNAVLIHLAIKDWVFGSVYGELLGFVFHRSHL